MLCNEKICVPVEGEQRSEGVIVKRINWKTFFSFLLIVLMAGSALAVNGYLTTFNTQYGTAATVLNTCVICHPTGGGNDAGNLNPFANAFTAAGNNYTAIENLDSDGDGFTNIAEINARTFPGDATSFPVDSTAPIVTAFTIPATAAALTVTITTFTATDAVGVTGYLLTESATAPAAGAAGWTATAPASYTFASAGSNTLYAWAKDAAGNVSASLNASVVITLPPGADTTPPVVTAFAIPATSTTLLVSITTFTATDAVGVTGYLLTETAAAPAAGAAGWTATAPASYTFATFGSKTLYAWAKDAAGNVSASLSASVVVAATILAGPTNTAPANGSTVILSPALQIATAFPDTTGNSHKSTNWQIANDAAFAATGIVFSSMADTSHLISLNVPPGLLLPAQTYYWRAATINSANQTSAYSTATSFTTQTVTLDPTGTVPDALTVKSGGTPITNLAALSPAQLAAAGNISSQLVSGANSVPLVNAGAGTDLTKPGMMIVKANGGTGQDVLGIVTPAGVVIENVDTMTTSDSGFGGAPIPSNINFPYGVASFRLSGITPGASINVTIYTPTDLPSGAIWSKYSPVRGWLKIDATGIYDSAGNFIDATAKFNVAGGRGVLTITDNGFADFSTELVGGKAIVLDPGGPATAAAGGPAPGDGGNSGGCFIATAAFGSPIDPYVNVLKKFRDTYLATHAAGRLFVKAYYRISPPIAKYIEANVWLKYMVRIGLLPVIGFSLLALQVNLAAAIIVAILLFMVAGFAGMRLYRRRKQPLIS